MSGQLAAHAASQKGTKLAVAGGEPIVPHGYTMRSVWPRILPEDIDRILEQVRSGLLTEMSAVEAVRAFEHEIAAAVRTRLALITNSGTAALHCAVAALRVEPGDEVVVPALTYIACAAAVIHHNAIPVFADIDPLTFNVTADTISEAITARTRAIIVVHMHGLPADLDGIRGIARKHGLPIIEDFSQAFGAEYQGRPVGGLAEVGVASLMAGKNLASAGEGGVLVTNDRELRNRAAALKCFAQVVASDGSYITAHETMGYNYRISLVALAMASQQLFRLDEYNALRRENAARLDAALGEIPGFSGPVTPTECKHVYHIYRFRFDPDPGGLRISPDQMREGLKRVFWAEGLPLVEFQNTPLPGHALLQRKVGYGRGCPWSCAGRAEMTYRIEDYPASLAVIRNSLIVGMPAQAPLCNPEVVGAYIRCFDKLRGNWRAFERFASELPAAAPWDTPARLF
jgi:dTDP-4-amino-4,6-dideoxygalactose transaminase